MRRVWRSRWLPALVLLPLLLAAACAAPPKLRWTGRALEGADFHERVQGQVVVHYALPTTPARAEAVAGAAATVLNATRQWGRLAPAERLELWLVPEGTAWPAGLAVPPAGREARAAAPGAVVLRAVATPGGLSEAIGVALTQAAGSAPYTVDWLHEGTGVITARGWDLFPLERQNLDPAAALKALSGAPGSIAYRGAAAALTALVMDRWGVDWAATFPRTPAQMTPAEALLWAASATDRASGLAYWRDRQAALYAQAAHPAKLPNGGAWLVTAADISPVRPEPKLAAQPRGPGPNDNYSPQAYEIAVRYEPGTRTVAGTVTLSWQNGESIPVETLYFNLWPNAEQFAILGGAIQIHEVKVDGQAAAYEARGVTLTVPLGRAVPDGGLAEVTIRFTTRLPGSISERNFGQEGTDRFNLTHWFPQLVVLDDRGWNMQGLPTLTLEPYTENARFHVRLDVPAPTIVGATGHQVSRVAEGDRWVYEYQAENFKDWVATGGKGLQEEIRTAEGVTVHLIDKPGGAWFRTTGDQIALSLKAYGQHFGQYPYSDLVVSCCAGMEWPGLIFTTALPAQEQEIARYLYVTHHELGHQWFYGVVGNDQGSETWLDEGFATYADRLFFRTYGLPPNGGDLRSRKYPPGLRVTTPEWASLTIDGGLGIYYYGGALALEDLEATIGQPAMDRLMQEWVRRFRFKTATTGEFIRLANEMTGQDLTDFFHQHGIDPTDRQPYQPPLPPGKAR
jgi:hypothetical protein